MRPYARDTHAGQTERNEQRPAQDRPTPPTATFMYWTAHCMLFDEVHVIIRACLTFPDRESGTPVQSRWSRRPHAEPLQCAITLPVALLCVFPETDGDPGNRTPRPRVHWALPSATIQFNVGGSTSMRSYKRCFIFSVIVWTMPSTASPSPLPVRGWLRATSSAHSRFESLNRSDRNTFNVRKTVLQYPLHAFSCVPTAVGLRVISMAWRHTPNTLAYASGTTRTGVVSTDA